VERALLEGLLADARSGRSRAVVLHGEPGVGKSVLIEHAVQLASDVRVLRASGVETEINLAFAGLDQLVRPILPLTDRLPARQRDALMGALGLADHATEDRYLVAAACLSLLSEAAETGPVLCVVEDAHWLDRPSVEALTFTARRLEAEGIAVAVATRDAPWPGLPVHQIVGLEFEEADQLLRERVDHLSPGVLRRLSEATGGNPLALIEVAGSLSADQLTGKAPFPRALPMTARIQESFLVRVSRLPATSQKLLVIAAADDTGDLAVILRASLDLGVRADALDAAERAELVVVDGSRITFRHPLVRAAVYQGATFGTRVAVHGALARALSGGAHTERRAWHLAAAATGPDDGVAGLLQESAQQALRRGGPAVASAGFERAAELSVAGPARARLLLAAAQAAFQAGLGDRAAALAERVIELADDRTAVDDVALLRGRIEFIRGSAPTAHRLLLSAAQGMSERDPAAAAAVLVEAGRAAWNAYDTGRLAEVADHLEGLHLPSGDVVAPFASTTVAINHWAAGRITSAITTMRLASDGWVPLASDPSTRLDPGLIEASLALVGFTRVTGDDTAGLAHAQTMVTECRTRGLIAWLPWALVNLSMTEAFAGRHSAAVASATEGRRLAYDLGQDLAVCGCEAALAWLAAVRGDEAGCKTFADHAIELSHTHQLAAVGVTAAWALGLLDLTLGRPERAAERFLDANGGPLTVPTVLCLIFPDLAEAAVRAGVTDDLNEYVVWYKEWAEATGQPWAKAALARCQALLARTSVDAEEFFVEALRHHEEAGPDRRPFDRARTQLLYGQWLRKARRRSAARAQLVAAYETFQRLGAIPWADRAAAELRVAGQTIRRSGPVAARLTPQELQVVRLVAQGGSNQEVAAQLFLSPRTVAYHLYKAFPKLGVVSRAALAHIDLVSLTQ
jgi:DNA-binding CsgD family transcriptional regulator